MMRESSIDIRYFVSKIHYNMLIPVKSKSKSPTPVPVQSVPKFYKKYSLRPGREVGICR